MFDLETIIEMNRGPVEKRVRAALCLKSIIESSAPILYDKEAEAVSADLVAAIVNNKIPYIKYVG